MAEMGSGARGRWHVRDHAGQLLPALISCSCLERRTWWSPRTNACPCTSNVNPFAPEQPACRYVSCQSLYAGTGKTLPGRMLRGDGEGVRAPAKLGLELSSWHGAAAMDVSAVWTLIWIWMGTFIQLFESRVETCSHSQEKTRVRSC